MKSKTKSAPWVLHNHVFWGQIFHSYTTEATATATKYLQFIKQDVNLLYFAPTFDVRSAWRRSTWNRYRHFTTTKWGFNIRIHAIRIRSSQVDYNLRTVLSQVCLTSEIKSNWGVQHFLISKLSLLILYHPKPHKNSNAAPYQGSILRTQY